jgi:hypothetical protein
MMIYREAIVEARHVQIKATEIHSLTKLLRVCSQTRSEAWYLFFRANDFEVSDLKTKFVVVSSNRLERLSPMRFERHILTYI